MFKKGDVVLWKTFLGKKIVGIVERVDTYKDKKNEFRIRRCSFNMIDTPLPEHTYNWVYEDELEKVEI